MNLRRKYCLIIFLVSSFLLSEEILFAQNLGVSFNIGSIADSKVFFDGEDKERKIININNASISLLFKNRFQLKYLYLSKNNLYPSFNLPYASTYSEYSFLYYIKKKTSLDLNFNFGYKYLFDSENLFNTSTILMGLSKENSNSNFSNFYHIEFLYLVSNYSDNKSAIKLSYPTSMQFIPKDNVPSNSSLHLLPSILIVDKNVHFYLEFGFIHQFK